MLSRLLSSFATTALVFSLFACSPAGSDQVPAEDTSALNRDLTLPQGGAQDPALSDRPRAEVPPARNPAPPRRNPTPPPVETTPPKTVEPPVVPLTPTAAPTTGSIPVGTTALANVGSRVCTSAKAGDKIVANISEALYGSNGVSIPAGAVAVLEVASANAITDSTKGNISFRLRSIESGGKTYAVSGSATPAVELARTRTTETKSDVKKVAGGAIAGAILGQILGKDTKATVIGAAAGAAAGTAVAVATGKYEGCMAEKSAVRIVLNEAIILPIG